MELLLVFYTKIFIIKDISLNDLSYNVVIDIIQLKEANLCLKYAAVMIFE